jgi:PGF-pre-PGF domain-containing protein
MTGETRTRLTAVAMAILLVTSGLGAFGGTAAASSGGNPAPTADPGELAVSLTDGDGTANATYRVDETAGTINASYAGDKPDVNVSYTNSATAVQFALDNATSENDTVVLGGGRFEGNVTVDQQSGVTIEGGDSRLENSSALGASGIEVRVSNVTIRNLVIANHTGGDTGGKGIYNYEDDLTLRDVRLADNGEEGLRSLGTTTAIDITAVDNRQNGLEVTGGPGSTFRNVTAKRNGNGLKFYSSSDTTVIDAVVANNDGNGIETNFNQRNLTYTNLTASDNGEIGAELKQGATLADSTVANNGESGVVLGDKGATLRNVVATGNARAGVNVSNIARGVYGNATNATLRNVTVTDNRRGVYAIPVAGANLTLTDVNATDNRDAGIDITPQDTTSIVDTVTADNGGVELNASASTSSLQPTVGALDGTNVTVGTTTFETLELTNVSVEGSPSPPAPAGDSETVRIVGDLARLDAGAYADATVEYTDTDALGLNESGFAISRYDAGRGSYATVETAVAPAANTVAANVTTFGPAVILGDPADGEGEAVVDGSSTGTLDVNGTEVVDASIDYTTTRSGTTTVSDLSSKPASVPNATDAGGVDVNRVASYVNVTAPEPTGGANATVELVVDRSRIDDPNDTQVWRYAGGGSGYQPLATQVQSVTERRVRLTFETPGFSVFVIGDPATETAGDESGSGGRSAGIEESILTAEGSVTQQLYDGTARQVTVAFDRPTTGTVSVEAVGGLPAAAPEPDGRTVAAVEVSVPDEATDRPATVEVTVPRTAVESAGVEPSALRVVRFDGGGGIDGLGTDVVAADDETVVVAAETPGFSTFAVIAPNQPAARTTGAVPTATPTASSTPTATPPPTATPTATATAASTDRTEATPTPDPTAGDGAGFGPLIALAALLTAAAAATVRRR